MHAIGICHGLVIPSSFRRCVTRLHVFALRCSRLIGARIPGMLTTQL